MKNKKLENSVFGLFLFLANMICVEAYAQAKIGSEDLKFWYTQPAKEWSEALPIGNGRLGAMVYGGIQMEHLQLNEETLWTGGPHSYDNPDAYNHLEEVRNLLKQEKYNEAEDTAEKMMGIPKYQMAYQPFGDLFLMFPQGAKSSNYRRELDLQKALSTVSYNIGETKFTRKVFASYPDQAIVMRLESDKSKQLTFDLILTSPHTSKSEVVNETTLVMSGQLGKQKERSLIGAWEGEGLKFASQVKVIAEGGEVIAQGDKISVRNANAVTLIYVAATSFVNANDVSADPLKRINDYLAATTGKSFEQLYQRHIDDYTKLFNRVSINLGSTDENNNIPTNERLNRVKEGASDPLLTEQVFQYGRYLMIAGSRPGTQPLNLQGIWNGTINPPWCSKYTININIQMNYWVAEVGNLSECHEPFLRMVHELQEPGSNTAKTHYKADGWVTHHNTDLWRGTAPVDGAHWGMWPTGGAWLCQHLWEHYLYTGDVDFLKKSYPVMKAASEFFLDVLVENNDGKLITSPSISPEHSHGGTNKDGMSSNRSGAAVIDGPTMDGQILRDLFANCIKASEILGVDKTFRKQIAETRNRLAPMKIGRHGQLQEWQEDWDNPENSHAHVSHLYGLFPSSQINRNDTPELFEAAHTSLIQRGQNDGWSGAWRIALWARVGDGDIAYTALNSHVLHGFTTNMFSDRTVFQIDANFGATAGIAEMLLQSHNNEIHVLPALPKAWPNGYVKGLRARGGFEVDIEWKDGKLVQATIHADNDGTFKIASQGKSGGKMSIKKGQSKVWKGV
ncbi:alpha-L-fucosidase 2 [Mariniflexile fucanivorans]|uniref:Alpha-L-fucosidase 2 n=1 Tax=Mariniflexile fucanivorans TaxID=264023 RepID=A0A4R1RJA7_9FLAO|nr:glycoside hydrolase family 95 protein [Mariniflexile fucanivorans]TCL66238.1 alpha-L-fucosidase 2 [Mariniflexile fucanivorans]